MKEPLIHIGMPKTATKTLQWRILARHSEVFYLGRYDGPQFRDRYEVFEECRDAEVQATMGFLSYRTKWLSETNAGSLAARVRHYLESNQVGDRLPVWSWESFCTDTRHSRSVRAHNLHRAFPDAKILVTIRHPIKLLESAFIEQLKRDNVGGRARRGKKHFFCDINDWIENNVENEIDNHLDYPRTIRTYNRLFGTQQVCVLVFEQLLSDKQAFYRQLTDFMKIGLDESLDLVGEHVDNSRWTEAQMQRLRSIDESFSQALRFRFSGIHARRKWLDVDDGRSPLTPGKKVRFEILKSLQDRIIEQTLSGNQWLDRTFNLGLEHYGYYENKN